MFRGSECARPAAPAGGVGGGAEAWMKVLCTEKPMCPSVPGVRRGNVGDSGVCGTSPGGVRARGVLTVALTHAGVEFCAIIPPAAFPSGTLQRPSAKPGMPWPAGPQPGGPHARPRRRGRDWPRRTELGDGVMMGSAAKSSFGSDGERGTPVCANVVCGMTMSSLSGWIHFARSRSELPPPAPLPFGRCCGGGGAMGGSPAAFWSEDSRGTTT
mmetsp:Transcript_33904/g.101078  ORF Transcript_33904/g.101078 Transcript_33904/m.101078 type:complete len:213 (+) Transcript_33904:549-1187(+)